MGRVFETSAAVVAVEALVEMEQLPRQGDAEVHVAASLVVDLAQASGGRCSQLWKRTGPHGSS